MPLSALVAAYDGVLLDLDGCVRLGEGTTPRAVEALAALRDEGRGIAFVTNGVDLLPEQVVRQLWALGIRTSPGEVVTVGAGIQHVLAEAPGLRRALVIGPEAVHRHVELAGLASATASGDPEEADVVVVAAHEGFDYAELRTATRAVLGGARILAAGRDATYPMPDGLFPGTGAVVAALEAATGVEATSVGKPEPALFRTALDRLGIERALVVGDRLESDAAGARAAGLDAACVLTGVSSRAEAEAALAAGEVVAVAPTLADLVLGA